MVFKRWITKMIINSDEWRRLQRRLRSLEKDIKKINDYWEKNEKDQNPTTVVEYINVEKVVVDRYEQSNNFGALGIKLLEGRLNIGANYGLSKPFSKAGQKPTEPNSSGTEARGRQKQDRQSASSPYQTPKTTIRARS
ncbi:hypothetical protein ACFO4N_00225 [Camelliibacillus cellulosilyticus]|uniref:Uncharacterized protein n=1 Tax=Camelliibacillus cellulosilyticus TaxID=2174486 RepID=A0ABV9GJ58_9BACL